MLKILSIAFITLSVSITAPAMDGTPQIIIQQVITELEDMDKGLQEIGWSDHQEDNVKQQIERLNYFELTDNDSNFKTWISVQPRHLQNWYQDTIHKKLEELYTKFVQYKSEQPAYQQFTDSLYVIKLDNQEKPILVRKANSSGNKNDCLLYSIIRDDQAVLAWMLGDKAQAQQILSIPEIVDRSFEEGEVQRDLTPVRQKILDDIKKSLKINDNFSGFIQAMLQDPAAAQNYENNINDYLTKYLAPQYEHMLPQEMAIVISGLYNLNIQVFTPTFTIPTESKVLHNSIKLTDEQAGEYQPANNIEPIYVYHRGVGGCHYQKLYVLES